MDTFYLFRRKWNRKENCEW